MCRWMIAIPGKFISISVSACWVHINFDSIAKIEEKMNQAVLLPLVSPDVNVGDVCAAKFPIDNKWVRYYSLSTR